MNPLFSTDGSVLRYPIDPGQEDAASIVQWLNLWSEQFGRSPDVRAYAELLLPVMLKDNDLRGITRAVIDFVKRSVTYVPDPNGAEFVITPLYLLDRILHTGNAVGDCDDHVLLAVSMLHSFGINARVVGVKESDVSTWFDHVIAQVLLPDDPRHQWVDVDLCAKGGVQRVYNGPYLIA